MQYNITSQPQSHLGRAHHYTSWKRLLDSPASCTIPTADESNHSATGTLHRHGNATCLICYTAL